MAPDLLSCYSPIEVTISEGDRLRQALKAMLYRSRQAGRVVALSHAVV